jgi:hypothetical protein
MRTLLFILLIPLLSSCNSGNLHTDKLYVGYDYGNITFKTDPNSGEQISAITILLEDGFFSFSDGVKSPKLEYDFLVPGDYLSITYENDLVCQESYPVRWMVSNGKLLSAEYKYTNIIEIENENIARNEEGMVSEITNYGYYDEYVILDKNLNYVALDNYNGDKLYASVDSSRAPAPSCPVGALCEPTIYPLGALFAFNPRI